LSFSLFKVFFAILLFIMPVENLRFTWQTWFAGTHTRKSCFDGRRLFTGYY